MSAEGHVFKSDFALRNQAIGKIEGEAEAVLTVLAGRGLSVSDEVRRRILACEDQDVLTGWLLRVAAVQSAEELLG
ncbi:hypothetical protein AGRA3207_006124 [Actinomadura graeca]|uniref:Uncharacterized protein n=1 Tax=Actinomadura graeca TaxID=2750812 RepID=A0ABX8R138_9ACTN|nr:hypothetical protein [Actinomadura graeca]QXJ24737.1 hypothetical protein AGRA3207_006124 [Actinomadura graeca]